MSTLLCCEILKALRGESMTRAQLAEHLELQPSTAAYHLQTMIRAGLVVEGAGEKGKTGPAPTLYSVSRRWRDG